MVFTSPVIHSKDAEQEEPGVQSLDFQRVDARDPTPLYHQACNAILEAIHSDRLKAGEKLPTEAELCQLLGVSRITIRQALGALIQSGHLVRNRPRGPLTVGGLRIEQRLTRLPSFFTDDALAQGHLTKFTLLGARRISARGIDKALGIRPEANAIKVERLLTDQRGPLAILTCFVPEHLCPNLLDQDLTGSLMGLIEHQYGLRFTRAVQWLSARSTSERESQLLAVPRRSPVVIIKRISSIIGGEVIELFECVLRADRYDFVMELSREENGAAASQVLG